jgi:hypothetical protein
LVEIAVDIDTGMGTTGIHTRVVLVMDIGMGAASGKSIATN